MSTASLASATGSRVDSASKHIIPCKVHTDFMAATVADQADPHRELQVNKHKYCMAKDDIVIGLGRAMYSVSINTTKRKAYPAVIVTLGGMNKYARKWLAIHNFACQGYMAMDTQKDVFFNKIDPEYTADKEYSLRKEEFTIIRNQIKDMMDMYFMGVALGTAWASPMTGDTVGSVMIGGLRTILNGDFQVSTGDLLMFYWPDERCLFEDDGSRKKRQVLCNDTALGTLDWGKVFGFIKEDKLENNMCSMNPTGADRLRKNYYGMGNGNYDGKNQGKIHVALIKPYITSRHLDARYNPEHFPCDKARIFGRAISNARPWEPCDVMISKQSL